MVLTSLLPTATWDQQNLNLVQFRLTWSSLRTLGVGNKLVTFSFLYKDLPLYAGSHTDGAHIKQGIIGAAEHKYLLKESTYLGRLFSDPYIRTSAWLKVSENANSNPVFWTIDKSLCTAMFKELCTPKL